MKILICLQSGKIPFLTSLYSLLEKKKFKINFLANNKVNYGNLFFFLNKKKIKKNYKVFIKNNYVEYDNKNITKIADKIEKKYKFKISYLLSFDRALGRGFLFNVDNYPEIIRANWNYENKLKYFLQEFLYFEKIIKKNKPKFLISLVQYPILNVLTSFYKIKHFSLSYSKLGERFIWSDNEFPYNKKLINSLKGKKKIKNNNFLKIEKIINKNVSSFGHSVHKYGYFENIKSLIVYVFLEFYRLFRGTRKAHSYRFLSNLNRIIIRPFIYKKISKIGLSFEKIKKKNYIYVPLHLEPEMALQNFSPEFNNTYEMITWICKSLPANHFVVIKEHPEMYGLRSIKYLNKIFQIPNLIIAKPNVNSLKLIKKCKAVGSITGTAAFEAVYLNKPVLSFGKHQVINILSSVFYCTNFAETQSSLNKILSGINLKILKKNKIHLIKSIYDNSFELSDFDKLDDAFYTVKRSLEKKFEDMPKWEKMSNIAFKNLLPLLK